MKRLPIFFTLLALIALSASLAYWGMQLFLPKQRPLAAAPALEAPPPSPEAAAGLFGGQALAAASNYQLRGVVASLRGSDSVAIISTDGQPPVALPVGKEVAPGVVVKEVQPRFVMLSEGGVLKRIDLAQDATAGPELAAPAYQPAPPQGGAPMPPPGAPTPASPPLLNVPQPPGQVQMPGPSRMTGGPPEPAQPSGTRSSE